MLTAQHVKLLASKLRTLRIGFNKPLSKAQKLSADRSPELAVLQETRLCYSFRFLTSL